LKYNRDKEPRHGRNVEPKPIFNRVREPRKEWNTKSNVNQSHTIWKEKLLYASVVGKGCKGEKKNVYPIVFKAKLQHLEWLDNCFIGRSKEPSKAKDMKKSFILTGFNFIRVRFLGGNCILLSGEDASLIKKTIDENKEWFESIFESITPWEKDFMVLEKYVWAHIRGLPLNLWSRQNLESIVSMVGTLVEIDKYTLEMEELEYARVLIKFPVAREVQWTNCMKINETMCQIVIEEEIVINMKKDYIGEWENHSDDDEIESFVGREYGASEDSEFGRNLILHGDVGEETAMEEVEGFLYRESWRSYTEREDRDADVEDQQNSGLQKTRHINEVIDDIGEQDRCFNEAVVDLEEASGQCNVALNEVGDQRQTLTKIKKKCIYVDIGPFECDWC